MSQEIKSKLPDLENPNENLNIDLRSQSAKLKKNIQLGLYL